MAAKGHYRSYTLILAHWQLSGLKQAFLAWNRDALNRMSPLTESCHSSSRVLGVAEQPRCVWLEKLFSVAMQHKLERWCDAPASNCEAVPFRARSSLLRCPHTCGKEYR